MNQRRRKRLMDIEEKLSELYDLIEEIKDEEEEYKDNMPENLQGSERYEIAEECVSQLEDAIEGLDTTIGAIQEAYEQ